MKIVKRKANELKHFKNNPRTMTETEMDKLKRSISKFGLVDPLVIDEKNNIIGGNQRYDAGVELGFKEFDCSLVVGLSEKEKNALNIALNKISGEWDNKNLIKLLENIKKDSDIFLLSGFTETDLNNLVNDDKKLVSFLAKEKEYDENIETKCECPKCHYKFDFSKGK